MRLIAKWISQVLTVIAACVAGDWSLVDAFHLMHDDGSFHLFGMTLQGPKNHVELGLRLFISVCAIALIAATDVWDVYVPRRKLNEFRTEYLKLRAEEWKTKIANAEIRLSIWYAKRPGIGRSGRCFTSRGAMDLILLAVTETRRCDLPLGRASPGKRIEQERR